MGSRSDVESRVAGGVRPGSRRFADGPVAVGPGNVRVADELMTPVAITGRLGSRALSGRLTCCSRAILGPWAIGLDNWRVADGPMAPAAIMGRLGSGAILGWLTCNCPGALTGGLGRQRFADRHVAVGLGNWRVADRPMASAAITGRLGSRVWAG